MAASEGGRGGQEGVDAEGTCAAVERSLSRLLADQCEVLLLRLFGEHSYREIAVVPVKKSGMVCWLISTGLWTFSAETGPLIGLVAYSPLSAQPVRGAQ